MHRDDAGVDPLIVTLPCAFAYICGIVGLMQPEYRLYAFYARLVPRLTYGLHHIKVASRVPVSLTIVDMVSATEALNGEVKKESFDQHCGFMFVGKKRFVCESPRSYIKLTNIVETSNFVLQRGV
jgi:hypothetical protein